MNSSTSAYQPVTAKPSQVQNLWWRRFRIRLWNWEYWPTYIFNIPVVFTWLWNALKARDLFFFTLTNPGIETGGFFGESKSAILNNIPDEYKPTTVLLKATVEEHLFESIFEKSGLTFPVIAKPEIGERGWLISRINSMEELKNYLKAHPIDFIIQTYVELPLEVSIMVFSMPDGSESKVTSICEKSFLTIEGDGVSTVEELILASDRAVLQFEKLVLKFGEKMKDILPQGRRLMLEAIGNHCRGTMFLNRNDNIDEAIRVQMVKLLGTMPDVFYGRFDMRVASWESLRQGKDIRVLEFNGTSSDPAHIYQPGYSLIKAYSDIFYHWHVMYRISRQNRRAGMKPERFKKIVSALIIYFRYKRTN
ncbi:MAG: hypothetical protein IPP15_05510 [Saprospiraceae bacterium]|uniref:ATP-grasp domain-containing protein n=1 Tax=Candidatus Opimibacter skivensis TaxID=2982028 RepID=A0A9D7ST95_9BACT|nr:hypothetical protein [Candidatus Opimibacter skivensis]